MAEAPEAEGVFQVGEFFAQLVQVPVLLGVAVDLQPGLLDRVAGLVGLGPVALVWLAGTAMPRRASRRRASSYSDGAS